jgi:hypothetical protein
MLENFAEADVVFGEKLDRARIVQLFTEPLAKLEVTWTEAVESVISPQLSAMPLKQVQEQVNELVDAYVSGPFAKDKLIKTSRSELESLVWQRLSLPWTAFARSLKALDISELSDLLAPVTNGELSAKAHRKMTRKMTKRRMTVAGGAEASLDEDVVKRQHCLEEIVKRSALFKSEADAFPVAFAVATVEPALRTYLKKQNFTPDDARLVLEAGMRALMQDGAFNSMAKRTAAATANPAWFFNKLAGKTAGASRLFILMQLYPKLRPFARQHNFQWSDVLAALDAAPKGNLSDLEARSMSAGAFLTKFSNCSAEVKKRLLLMRLRPKLQNYVESRNVSYEDDITPIMDEFDVPEDIEYAMGLGSVASGSDPRISIPASSAELLENLGKVKCNHGSVWHTVFSQFFRNMPYLLNFSLPLPSQKRAKPSYGCTSFSSPACRP